MNQWTTHFLNASGQLTPYRSRIETLISRVQTKIGTMCPIHKLDIVVQVSSVTVIPEIGICGHCPAEDLVYLSIDPDNPKLEKPLGQAFERIIAHEYHHAMRWKTVGYGQTLGEALISEGLAGHFVRELYNSQPESWECAIAAKDMRQHIPAALSEYDNTSYSHAEWFFGTGKFQNWLGYSMGFELVRQYLTHHPNTAPSRLADKPAIDFKPSLQLLSDELA